MNNTLSSKKSWTNIHETILELAAFSKKPNKSRYNASLNKLNKALLNQIEAYGVTTDVIATLADFIESPYVKAIIYNIAFERALLSGDQLNQFLIANDVAKIYWNEFSDSKWSIKWIDIALACEIDRAEEAATIDELYKIRQQAKKKRQMHSDNK